MYKLFVMSLIDNQKYNVQYYDLNGSQVPDWYYRQVMNGDVDSWNEIYNAQLAQPQNVLESWFNSEQTANNDMARQLYAQNVQNIWESAPEQMKRLKEAGINANFGASAVAGSASAGASPMPSSQTDSINPLADIAQVAGAVTGGVSNLASAGKAIAESKEVSELLPWKKIGLQSDTLLDIANLGLTRAQARAVAIANHYAPQQFQLGIAKMRLELPMMLKQMRVLNSEYKRNMKQADLFVQEVEESKASVSLMDYTAMKEKAQAMRDTAEANLIHKRFELLRSMNWDPATGLEGLFGTYLVHPDFSEDDVNKLSDNLTNFAYDMAKYKFLGDNNLPYNDGRSLFELRTLEENAKSHGARKDIPVNVEVGPFKTSTNLRDFLHENNNKPSTFHQKYERYSKPYRK